MFSGSVSKGNIFSVSPGGAMYDLLAFRQRGIDVMTQSSGHLWRTITVLIVIVAAVTGSSLLIAPAADAQQPSTPSSNAQATDARNPDVNKAIEKFQNMDFDGALKSLEAACEKNSDLAPAQIQMANFFAQANQTQGVLVWLERAVIAAPDDPAAYVIMGDVARQESRVTEAFVLYTEAVKRLKTFSKSPARKLVLEPQALSGLAAVAEARGDWATAQKHLEAALSVDPKNAVSMVRLARALFQQKLAAECYSKLKEAYQLDKQNVLNPEASLAMYYEQYGDRKNAKKWMGYALNAAPKDVKTLLVAGQWALQAGQLDDALTQSTTALNVDPKSGDALLLRGSVAMFQKDYKTAETYFQQAYIQTPSNLAVCNQLALSLCEQEGESKKRQALEYATTLARQSQKSPEAAATYGWVLYQNGQKQEAERILRSAMSAGNITADMAYYLAAVLMDRERRTDDKPAEAAKQLLDAAVKTPRPFYKRQEAEMLLAKIR